ncbi:MAG TPA: hypothetical protein PLG83_11210, partial [Nitrosomonas sp.]|nr:hypothetical protein [Nitrosomonas sp.]
RASQGWRLAPAYDLNPTTQPFTQRVHKLSFNQSVKPSLDTCLELADYFALNQSVTDLALKNIGKSLGNWQLTAKRHQLRSDEIKRMSPSFQHEASQRLISMATKTISRSRSN